ncbi:MAG TPA: ATP-binding protein [Pyrinomonadaceae bacterium]|nr:ATP-binding protein [Pyrinomonadaceae bacterium]
MAENPKPNNSGATENDRDGAVSKAPDDVIPRVVYRRPDLTKNAEPTDAATQALSGWSHQLAPATMPLIVGFMLLLGLITLLGVVSGWRMDQVGSAVLNLEQHHAAKVSLLLKLRLAITKLDNEARARAEADARRELKPPFQMRLDAARREVTDVLPQLEHPPLAGDATWQKFHADLQDYISVTEDLNRYSLEGFAKFNTVDTELNAMMDQSSQEQNEVFHRSEQIELEAVRSVRMWNLFVLIVGALVAAGTIWEVQRRFAANTRSIQEAGRERAFANQLLEGMVSAVAAIDENDRIRSANSAFFRIFPGASIGASIHEEFASNEALRMLEAASASRVDHATYRGRWLCPPGADCDDEQTFDVYSSPLAINGNRGQILTLVDVTEAAEAERGMRRQESLAAVGQATAQVAHEIRNPLGSIRLGVAMLRDNVTDAEGLNTIELVERGIRHLNKLVVDVAQFSRRKALDRSAVELNDLVDHSLDLAADKINEKRAKIEKRYADDNAVGNWDFDQLSQVFVNLIANAVDASPKNATLTITTETVRSAAKRVARISIQDQGIGMDQSTRERIFEPFFTTKKRGTGLGLAIVKQIIEQHEGHVRVESEPEQGTKFTIDLPL